MQVTFSNRLELLFNTLSPHLYGNKISAFDKILVVVPSIGMKNWLIERAASTCNIAFGFEVVLINEALGMLGASKGKTPSAVELAMRIEQELKTLHDHPFTSLFQDPQPTAKKAEIALEIAEIFLNYGEYAKKGWENSSTHWQAELWKRIYSTHWMPLHSYLEKFNPVLPMQIHLFGLSYLSEIKQKFFEQLNLLIPVHFWILSPSRMLWTDHKSKKEQFFISACLEKRGVKFSQIQELQEYLEESHSLIGNNGRLGRKWREKMEDSFSSEIYEVASHPSFENFMLDGVKTYVTPSLTLLEAVQADLTLLANLDSLKFSSDRSIEIHSAPSRLREVEALYETLLRAAVEEKMLPSEMIVMAPCFEKYIPFIKMVFGKEDSLLPFEILERSLEVSPFFDLMAFAMSRWEIDSLFELMENLKCPLKSEDLLIIKNLLHKEGTRWGIDSTHRENQCKQPLIDKGLMGTFAGGFESLINHLLCGRLNNTHAEALDQFLNFFKKFHQDLKPFLEEKELSLKEWKEISFHLLSMYFNEDETLTRILRKMNGIGFYSAKSFFVYLQKLYSSKSSTISIRNLQAVRFCPLLPMRAIPSSLVALLGMNSDVFPRIERRSSLFAIEVSLPSQTDYDRYLFLESLLSARKKWVLSFVETDSDSPSSLVQEVMHYLDKLAPHHNVLYKHPDLPFDASYFIKDAPLKSLSQENFRRALACRNINLTTALEIGPPLPISSLDLERVPRHLTLHQLKSLFYHPIRYYLNQAHGIYLQKEEFAHPDMEEFSEERLWDSEWLKWALQYPIEKVVEIAEGQGKLPIEPFKEASKMRLRKNLTEWKGLLTDRGISLQSIFEIEFSYDCQKVEQISSSLWKAPAIEINYYGKPVFITGVLPYVSEQGYLSLRELKKETLATMLPEMLLLQELPKEIVDPKIFFIKKNKEFSPQKITWCSLLDHYVRSLHQPLPHHPTWISTLLSEDPKSLPINDCPYLKWAFPKGDLECAQLIQDWKKETRQLFGSLFAEEDADV